MAGWGILARLCVRSWLVAATCVLLAAIPALAAVKPGIYFDVDRAAAGQTVTLFSAADYIVCWSVDAPDQVLEDRPVYLAPANVAATSPDDPKLIAVRGTWSESDGALRFSFKVPQLETGRYDGYIACRGGTLDRSSETLQIVGVPSTDAGTPATPAGSTSWAPVMVLASVTLGFVIGLIRAGGIPGRR